MSALPVTDLDRRNYPRTSINSEIMYKPMDDTSFCIGTLVDISRAGALINVDQELDIDSHIHLVFASTREDEAPIKLSADIIRTAEPCGDLAYSYGCMILDVEELWS